MTIEGDLWTRVINVDKIGHEEVKLHLIKPDIDNDTALSNQYRRRGNHKWEPRFSPIVLDREKYDYDIESETLDMDELLDFGIIATGLRKKVLESAIHIESAREGLSDEDNIRYEKLQKKLYRSKHWHQKELAMSDPPNQDDKFFTDGRIKKFSITKLTTTDKIGIIHEVMVDKKPFADVAA